MQRFSRSTKQKKTWKSWSIMQEMKALCLFYSKATDVFLTLYHLRILLLFKYFTVVCNFNALDKWNTPPKLCYCRILCLHGQLLYIHSIIWEVRKNKTLAFGTVRSNSVGLLKEICGFKEKAVKHLKREECLYREKGNLTCMTGSQLVF